MAEGEKIIKINIEEEMKTAYIDYSMSVIVSRALPDVRDGLKPVHRRVLFGMLELGVLSNRPYKKSARIVGEVLGKYHPHGDTSVYDTMVRMAQDWSLRYPLVEGQGNYGSMDGDPPAAMRYTEARLRKIAEEILSDIDKETVDFRLNFDDTLEEPTVLPCKVPNLLINGSAGIAVGMATNMPPHNLSEVVDGICAYIDNRDITIQELMHFVKAPDFPTGGIIYGYEGVRSAFETGRGRVVMRAKTTFESLPNGKEAIIVNEVPYQLNKAEMIKRTADLVNEKKIEGISDIRDESDREGIRVVYELKRDAIPGVVLNNLFKYTDLQTSFSVNNIALVKGRPMMLNLKDMMVHFVDHRHEVIVRRTKFELGQAEKRAHILEGLLIAQANIDEVIKIIREAETPDSARTELENRFQLSEIQSRAILEMRLRQLTSLEVDKLKEEYDELMKLIARLKEILANESLRMQIIKDEMLEMKQRFGDERRSQIEYSGDEISIEDLIEDEAVVITISHLGYIKRTPLAEYKVQNRGGRGSIGSKTRDTDFLEHLFVATTHNYLLLFTEKGRCFWLKVYEIPDGDKTGKGRPIQNVINIEPGDKVKAYINVKTLQDEEYINNNYVIMCTKKGTIKKTTLEAYSRPRVNGINAINIKEGDELLEAKMTNGQNEIMIAAKLGRAVRFPEANVRPMGRNATGVRAIRLNGETDEVIGMVCVPNEETSVMVVSEKGYGKRTTVAAYRITKRGGKGVKTLKITDKTGDVIAIHGVSDMDDLMIITEGGITIRMHLRTIREMARATQGVRLIKLHGSDQIAAVAKIDIGEYGDLAEEEDLEENSEFLVDQAEIDSQIAASVEEEPEEEEEDEPETEEGEGEGEGDEK
ncbi:MAG: DNA gyrase subunit A [Bacteroidia bacterium]|nr:DNA gyrase subunit A [Bacteroidia bacterium]